MIEDYLRAMDMVTLSEEADEHILRRIRKAQSACGKGKSVKHMRNNRKRTLRTLAAALAAVLLIGTSAYAVTERITMKRNSLGDSAEIMYESADDAYIELGIRYPSYVPDTYGVSFVSDPVYGCQNINYLNSEGMTIRYEYTRADRGFSVELEGISSEETVSAGGTSGIMYTLKSGQRVLFWTNDNAGIGYMISTDDRNADIIMVADSVCEQEEALSPTYEWAAAEALEELGDHNLTVVPEGFISVGTTGMPRSLGGGWYSYVRRFYVNRNTNTDLIFAYESYKADYMENTADNILALEGNGDRITVNGMPGMSVRRLSGNSVYWVDTENCVMYMIYSDRILMDDLIELAQHVR